MSQTPVLGMTEFSNSQSNAEVPGNEALRILERTASFEIIDTTLTAPPGSPNDGDAYVVGGSATGDWATHDNEIALYNNGGWLFFPAKGGMVIFDKQAKEWWGYSSVESLWHPLQAIWSTTEHWTGMYRNAKKVYSKMVDFGALPNATLKTVAHSITGIDWAEPVTMEDTAVDATNKIAWTLPHFVSSLGLVCEATVNDTDIAIWANYDASGLSAKIRLLYTK